MHCVPFIYWMAVKRAASRVPFLQDQKIIWLFLSGLLLVVRLVVGGRRICLTINQTFLNCFYEISQEGSCQIYCATIYLLHWGPFRGRMVVTSTPPPHLSRDFATCKHFKLKQLMATTPPLWSSQWSSSPFKRPHSYHPPKLSAFNQWIHVTKRQLRCPMSKKKTRQGSPKLERNEFLKP